MPRGSTTARGYGYQHEKLRRALLGEAYGQLCHFCNEPMLPGQKLHLDHTPDRAAYRGFAHAECNQRDGGRRGGQRTRGKTRTWTTTRNW